MDPTGAVDENDLYTVADSGVVAWISSALYWRITFDSCN